MDNNQKPEEKLDWIGKTVLTVIVLAVVVYFATGPHGQRKFTLEDLQKSAKELEKYRK